MNALLKVAAVFAAGAAAMYYLDPATGRRRRALARDRARARLKRAPAIQCVAVPCPDACADSRFSTSDTPCIPAM